MILFILSPFLAQEVAEVGVEEPVSFRAGSGSLRGPGIGADDAIAQKPQDLRRLSRTKSPTRFFDYVVSK
jgi:hypothetical protein